MLSFLSSFSASFLVAIVVWPLLAGVLTLPILIYQYRRYNKLLFGHSVLIYVFILYLLGLVSFTLYPMPDNPAAFCVDYHLSPQLNVLQFIGDIRADGVRALLQIAMNVAFFVPFGFFARYLFGWRFMPSVLVSFLVSLGIETAQLTGAFGLYPCSYRLFDIDDLAVNTLGGVVGFGFALLIPKRELERADKEDEVKNPGLLRMLVALIVDQMCVVFLYSFVAVLIRVFFGADVPTSLYDWTRAASLLVVYFVVPYTLHGWSFGSRLVRFSHDNAPRGIVRRTLFYVLRFIYIALVMVSGNIVVIGLVIIVTMMTWRRWKKLPYQVI